MRPSPTHIIQIVMLPQRWTVECCSNRDWSRNTIYSTRYWLELNRYSSTIYWTHCHYSACMRCCNTAYNSEKDVNLIWIIVNGIINLRRSMVQAKHFLDRNTNPIYNISCMKSTYAKINISQKWQSLWVFLAEVSGMMLYIFSNLN